MTLRIDPKTRASLAADRPGLAALGPAGERRVPAPPETKPSPVSGPAPIRVGDLVILHTGSRKLLVIDLDPSAGSAAVMWYAYSSDEIRKSVVPLCALYRLPVQARDDDDS